MRNLEPCPTPGTRQVLGWAFRIAAWTTQRLQNPLIKEYTLNLGFLKGLFLKGIFKGIYKEYTLNHNGIPNII